MSKRGTFMQRWSFLGPAFVRVSLVFAVFWLAFSPSFAESASQQLATQSYANSAAQSESNWRTASAALTTNPSFNSKKLTSVATPTTSTDVATKGYVDGLFYGGQVMYGTFGSRSAASAAGRVFIPSNGGFAMVDTGTAWAPIIGGILGVQPSAASAWTVYNGGTYTLTDVNGKVRFEYATTSLNARTMAKSMSYTNSVRVTASFHNFFMRGNSTTTGIFSGPSVVLRNSTTGKSAILYTGFSNGDTAVALVPSEWTSETTRNSFISVYAQGTVAYRSFMSIYIDNTSTMFFQISDDPNAGNWTTLNIGGTAASSYFGVDLPNEAGWGVVVSGAGLDAYVDLVSFEVQTT